jgi:uncharacterized membrane protein (TIGR02234 family)
MKLNLRKLTLRNVISLELICTIIVLIAVSRSWVSATYSETGFPSVSLSLSANQLNPSLSGMALAAIASALGAIATRGVFRRIVGAVIVCLGSGIVLSTTNLMNNLDQFVGINFEQAIGRQVSGWATEISHFNLLVLPAGLIIAICGIVIAVKSFDTSMSKRYERNSSLETELTPWQALDKGIDPTIQGHTDQQLD